MAKKISDEERIVEFFHTAVPEKVETVFNIIKSIAKKRIGAKPAAKKNTTSTKKNGTTSATTEVAS